MVWLYLCEPIIYPYASRVHKSVKQEQTQKRTGSKTGYDADMGNRIERATPTSAEKKVQGYFGNKHCKGKQLRSLELPCSIF